MAINYERVNWDTTSYVNPHNMNQMDEGIEAACNAADENSSAITAINSKLQHIVKIQRAVSQNTTETFDFTNHIPSNAKIIGCTLKCNNYSIPFISGNVIYTYIDRINDKNITVANGGVNWANNYVWTFALTLEYT